MNTIKVEYKNAKIVHIDFSNPPVNVLIPETIYSLHKIVKELSEDEKVHVVIFSSSVNDYFYNHFNNADPEAPSFLQSSFEQKFQFGLN